MNGSSYLLDSNVIIRLSKREPTVIDFVAQHKKSAISLITYMEVLGFPFLIQQEFEFVQALLNVFNLIQIDQSIVDQTIKLRQCYKIKLPDAIIAATAQVYDLTLVTQNTNDFKNIENLNMIER
jgi:predicted nucleic acid-binding protein